MILNKEKTTPRDINALQFNIVFVILKNTGKMSTYLRYL